VVADETLPVEATTGDGALPLAAAGDGALPGGQRQLEKALCSWVRQGDQDATVKLLTSWIGLEWLE
jgi:hypothetical protein